MSFKDFLRRFQCLIEQQESSLYDVLDDRAAAGRLLEKVGVFAHHYKLGLSQVNEVSVNFCIGNKLLKVSHSCR